MIFGIKKSKAGLKKLDKLLDTLYNTNASLTKASIELGKTFKIAESPSLKTPITTMRVIIHNQIKKIEKITYKAERNYTNWEKEFGS